MASVVRQLQEVISADQGDATQPTTYTQPTASYGASYGHHSTYHSAYAAPKSEEEFYSMRNGAVGAGDNTMTIMMTAVVLGYGILSLTLFFAW